VPKSNNVCFAIMPFRGFDNQWKLAFRPAIRAAGLEPLRADEGMGANTVVRDITRCIYGARLIIADVSGRNPNVLYELGLAHAAKKPVIILVQHEEDIPFDLRHIRYLMYDALNLDDLRPELEESIKNTLAIAEADRPDFFPELKVLSEDERQEFEYLRQRARPLEITVIPEDADIFFNDRFVGASPQTVRVNPAAPSNTVSAVAVEHLEDYHVITDEDLERGEVVIRLESATGDVDWNRLVPRWLRFRRKYPDNPVLMRAVAKYFSDTGSADEALAEAHELLEAAPAWYMAHVMLGYVYLKPALEGRPEGADLDEAAKYFRNAAALEPRNFVGHFNLAVVHLLRGDFGKCLEYLERILQDEARVKTFRQVNGDLFEVYAAQFEPLRTHAKLKDDFASVVSRLRAA
jgi:tetratricopeptide (TPR) repeat protein